MGQTSTSARDLQVPLFGLSSDSHQADVDVGRRPGGLPHKSSRVLLACYSPALTVISCFSALTASWASASVSYPADKTKPDFSN